MDQSGFNCHFSHYIIDIILDEIVQDKCLLTNEEYAMGPEMWNETMEELDTSKLSDMACEGRGKRWQRCPD